MTQVAERGGSPRVNRATPLPPPPYPKQAIGYEVAGYPFDEPTSAETGYGYDDRTAVLETSAPQETSVESNGVEFDLDQPEVIFEAILNDPVMTMAEKLSAIETARQSFMNAAETRLQVAESSAQYTRQMADRSAREQKDAVARENMSRKAEAGEKGRVRLAAAERDAATLLAEAQDQLGTVQAEKQLIAQFPKKWPAAIDAQIREFDEDKHMTGATVTAVGYRDAARRFADDLSNRALREGERNLKRIEKAADRLQREQGEVADQILRQANAAYLALRAAVTENYGLAKEMILRQDLEQRRKQNDPSISLPGTSTHSIPVDLSALASSEGTTTTSTTRRLAEASTAGQDSNATAEDIESADVIATGSRHRRELPAFLRGRKGIVAAAAGVVIAISATTLVEVAGSDTPGVSVEFKADEAKAPQWAAPSLKAWQPLVLKTAQDPRIAAGKDNYIAGSSALGRGQEQVVYSLMALSSLGDPQYEGGLLNFNPDLMKSSGTEIGITYDPAKHDPEQTLLIGEHIIDKTIQGMLATPGNKQEYQHDRKKFYTDLANALKIDSSLVDFFVGLNIEATDAQSPTFQKVYDAWKSDYDKAAADLQQIGLLPK